VVGIDAVDAEVVVVLHGRDDGGFLGEDLDDLRRIGIDQDDAAPCSLAQLADHDIAPGFRIEVVRIDVVDLDRDLVEGGPLVECPSGSRGRWRSGDELACSAIRTPTVIDFFVALGRLSAARDASPL
jgi:hypothetical protein